MRRHQHTSEAHLDPTRSYPALPAIGPDAEETVAGYLHHPRTVADQFNAELEEIQELLHRTQRRVAQHTRPFEESVQAFIDEAIQSGAPDPADEITESELEARPLPKTRSRALLYIVALLATVTVTAHDVSRMQTSLENKAVSAAVELVVEARHLTKAPSLPSVP